MDTLVSSLSPNTKIQRSNHYYHIDDVQHARVTSVLNVVNKPALPKWSAKVTREGIERVMITHPYNGEDYEGWVEAVISQGGYDQDTIRDTASAFGDQMHGAIEAWNKDLVTPQEPLLRSSLSEYLRWRGTIEGEFLASEEPVWSNTFKYAGTVDEVLRLPDGTYGITDFKTGRLYPEHIMQVGAYSAAILETTGVPVTKAWLLRLPRDGGAVEGHAYGTKTLETGASAFIFALGLHRGLAEIKEQL